MIWGLNARGGHFVFNTKGARSVHGINLSVLMPEVGILFLILI